MDPIYENTDFILSAVASGKNGSQSNADYTIKAQESEKEVYPPKWIKVLLIVFAVCLSLALGGLCILGILYVRVSVQLSAQETNVTSLTARYNTLREWLSIYDGGWIACGEKLYLFNSDQLNWSSSRDVCVSKGADLVTITNQTEQDCLVSKIKHTHWIGLNDLKTEGHWVWVNNQTLTKVQFWFSGGLKQPDNWKKQDPSGENCASLGDDRGNLHSWFDASCGKKKKFICEKKY